VKWLVLAAAFAIGAGAEAPVSREVLLMGTRATLTTWDADPARADARLERVLERLEDTESWLSTWRTDSEISRMNASAGHGAFRLSARACTLFQQLDGWVRETDGAFDPAIGSLIAAWDIHGDGRIPTAAELRRARAESGWMRLGFDAVRCTVTLPAGAAMDVGAFGKGEGIDVVRASEGRGAPWLVDLGGQIGVAGSPPEPRGWSLAIARPDDRSAALLTVRLTGGSISTSGGSESDRHVGGQRVGHILDPRTGRPAAFAGSVSVWHDGGLAADVLSTALYVMGPARGMAWAEAHGVAALFAIPRAGGSIERRATAAFRACCLTTGEGTASRPRAHDAGRYSWVSAFH
jgi:thiamine biosynthesis lipoprotein